MWKKVIDALGEEQQKIALSAVLRSRKKAFPICFNGSVAWVGRSMLRDHLKEKHPDVKRTYGMQFKTAELAGG